MNLREYTSLSDRREALEKELSTPLSFIGSSSIDSTFASTKHCENMIGFMQVPLGVAGPVGITNHESQVTNYYIPLATTEGALVASVSRGCKAVTESGGATVMSKKVGISRAPVFVVKNITQGAEFIKKCEEHVEAFKKIAESTSSHLTFLSMKSWIAGRNVFLRFSYDTQDAMGMNMATIASAAIVDHIERITDSKCIALSGNMCVDKKSNYLNFVEGRGFRVWADVVISREVIRSILKTTAKEIGEVWKRKVVHGSIMSGSIGANAHAANVLAAIFLATGQDIAHISEASSVVTSVEEKEEDIYMSVYLPDLPVGTVGGGTELPTQKEALGIMGIREGDKGKNAQKLAEIIGAAVLAGEVSLLASLAENTLAKAHKDLARGK